ncbi:MAG: hypothetical protein ABIR34_10265 [Marmoricola sp.]
MNIKKRIASAAAIGVVVVGGAAGVAAASNDDGDNAFTGKGAARATRAALDLTHGGRANSVEGDTENGATWEVEVTRTDGTTVDVRLDENYELVVIEGDSKKG